MVDLTMKRQIKLLSSRILSRFLRATFSLRQYARRLSRHALLASRLNSRLSGSVVVMGKVNVDGTGNIRLGENVLLYPNLHLETQLGGSIDIGDNVVLSSGVHIVAMAGVTIGAGTMIGEFSSVRDANHARQPDCIMRDAGYTATPITIGSEVWIGRGAAILKGVSIGDGATVGANAVVTRDVPAGVTVVGVPARPVRSNEAPRPLPFAAEHRHEDLAAADDRFLEASGIDRAVPSQSESTVS